MKTYPGHPKVLSDSALKGEKVLDQKGDALGKVEDFILDVTAGRVAMALLSLKGMDGKKLFPVPWEALELDTSRHAFVLKIEEGKLKDAPSFDKNKWPDLDDLRWAESVFSFYGQVPYWRI